MTDQPIAAATSGPPPSPPPRRGPSLGVIFAVLLALIGGVALGAFVDLPGALVRAVAHDAQSTAGDRGAHDHSAGVIAPPAPKTDADQTQRYTCSMHPWVLEEKPGQCPICRMDLVPVSAVASVGAAVVIDPATAQNIGVRVEPVVSGTISRTIRTVGAVEHDEAAVRDISLKVAGWVERMRISRVGEMVDRGEPLLEIYSPELYTAQGEFLAALQAEGRDASGDLTSNARRRLTLLGMTEAQIDALAARGEAERTTTLHSPHQGVVLAKRVNEGAYVPAGAALLRIADHSRVWIVASVYEQQLPFVRVGQAARATVPALAGRSYEGEIELIYPHVDAASRQARVRIVVDNPERALRPGMFAQIEIEDQLPGERVLAPRSAIIETGARTIALVEAGAGRFEPRDVQLGVEGEGDIVEVRSGLAAGERVVVSAQFLLDSEARLREALRAMTPPRASSARRQAPGGAVAPAEPSDATRNAGLRGALARALEAYLAIAEALARDAMTGVSADLARLAAALEDAASARQQTGMNDASRQRLTQAQAAARTLASAGDLQRARSALAQLSDALIPVLQVHGAPPGLAALEAVHCPMFREDQNGAAWIQRAGSVRNPYMGQAMLGCFDWRQAIPSAIEPASPFRSGAP